MLAIVITLLTTKKMVEKINGAKKVKHLVLRKGTVSYMEL
jgi:hypothetical protein